MTKPSNQNRGAVLHGVEDLRIEPIPVPEPGPGEVQVRMQVVGVCGSDVHFYEHARIGPFVVEEPLVLGHEPYGIVTKLGPGASRHRVGDRVSLEPGVPCGRCEQCRRGTYNLCPDVSFMAIPPTGGALAELVTINEDFAHPVPDSLPDEIAAMIEPLAVSLYAVERAGVGLDSRVLITGAGPIGLLALELCLDAGATSVAVSDVRESALAHARRLGATEIVNVVEDDLTDLDTEPLIHLECSGSPAAMYDGMDVLGPRGTSILVGVGPEEATLPVARIRRKELTVSATFRYVNSFPPALRLAATGRLDLESLITDRYDLDHTAEAFDAALRSRTDPSVTTVKALIDLRG